MRIFTRPQGPTRLVTMLVATGVAALLLGAVGAVLAESKTVTGTKHDLATPGNPACQACHIPRDPQGELLWAGKSKAGPKTSFSGLKPLCYSCHDGTVTATGNYVFDASRPEHVSQDLKGKGCDRCHDPHEAGYGKFVKVAGNANMCQSCPTRAGPDDHPVNVDARSKGFLPEDRTFDPKSGDFSGTRLWNVDGTAPGEQVKCLSCHSTHGAQPDTKLNSMPFSSTHTSFLPICGNCHFTSSKKEAR